MTIKQIFAAFILSLSLLHAGVVPISFSGNKQIEERELYDSINLYKPYFYEFWKKEPAVDPKSAYILSQTIENFYKSKGYFHVIVTHNICDDNIQIIIEENAPIIIADIVRITELDINSTIELRKGDVFDAQKFNQSKKDIKLLYADHGYCNAELNAKTWIDIDSNQAYLLYETTKNSLCSFGTIHINPTKSIDAKIIESLLYVEQDDKFSPNRITASYKSLYSEEGIAKAIIDTNDKNATTVNVDVIVDEVEKPIRFQVGAGISSDEGLMGLIGVKHRNLFGNLKTLGINARVTQIKQTLKTNFSMPLENRNTASAEAGIENEIFTGYKEQRVLGNMMLKQRAITHTFQEGLLFDYTNTYASSDKLIFPEGTLFIPSLMLEWGMDTRDNILEPSQGYFVRSNIAGSIKSDVSDASYYKFNFTGGYIFPMEKSIIALKAKFGSLNLLNGEIPASYRYYAGGMYSNRGYSYRQLGPTNAQGDPIGSDSILDTTAEYRFNIYGNIRGVLFLDNTALGNSDIPSFDKIYSSCGFGLRYKTPIGPIAIDFGFDTANPTEQYALHFHIGELF